VVRLPVTTLSEPQGRKASAQVLAPPAATVVVVEDNADSREVLCTILRQAGFGCHSASEGHSALKLVEEVLPDAVILDLGLPGIDGLEVARAIRQNPRLSAVRLIALTGYGQNSDRLATKNAGFDHHLVKPVQPAELLALLGRAGA
jgi:two-component system CheB/CheR fusion protein